MPGVNYAQSERRYSASNWYTDIDTALMGIQSTAQFDKYHHVIGKIDFSLTKFMFSARWSAKGAGDLSRHGKKRWGTLMKYSYVKARRTVQVY